MTQDINVLYISATQAHFRKKTHSYEGLLQLVSSPVSSQQKQMQKRNIWLILH